MCVLAGSIHCKPRQYRNGPELQLVKLTKHFLWCSNKVREFVFKRRYTKAVKHGISVYSPLSICSCLLSCPFSPLCTLCSPLLIFSIFSSPLSFFPHLLSFPSAFWLNKPVPLMSNDTSRSQSQLHDNKMPVTFCLATICVCLFPGPGGTRTCCCCCSQGFFFFLITLGCCCCEILQLFGVDFSLVFAESFTKREKEDLALQCQLYSKCSLCFYLEPLNAPL